MAVRATQGLIASLTLRGAPYVMATQVIVETLTRVPPPPAVATQILLEVLTIPAGTLAAGPPRLWLLRQPELHFIGVSP
jgi:hypothetical protein